MRFLQTLSQQRWKSLTAATIVYLIASIGASQASMEIQQVKSPGGISAWLVESNSLPLIAMKFSFRGGAAGDPKEKSGLASMLSALLDEGAGSLTSQAFQRKLEDLATRMSFSVGKDNFTVYRESGYYALRISVILIPIISYSTDLGITRYFSFFTLCLFLV